MTENRLSLENHVLVCVELDCDGEELVEFEYLQSNFCGRVLEVHEDDLNAVDLMPQGVNGVVYVCGRINFLYDKIKNATGSVKVIKELSFNVKEDSGLDFVTLGEVPINVHNAAVYYRDCLGQSNNKNYFDTLQNKHKFQALTESNKPGTSFRKGIYLSEVETNGEESRFHLLRCSTNLNGPTLGFVDEDREILAKVNELARQNFEQKTDLNHVLAQIYENSVTVDDANKSKQHKAKIKSHSDKTKDIPANGLIAFCTFYSSDINQYKTKPQDRFNRYFKDGSVLTRLRFKLKDDVRDLPLKKDFHVTLYPNSVLLIPLSTNRLYTHEIVPSQLPVGRFPTRLGYVVRCSNTKAVFRDGATFIHRAGREDVKLEKPTPEGIGDLKALYQQENITAEKIEYKDIFFSLNEGDYQRPLVE